MSTKLEVKNRLELLKEEIVTAYGEGKTLKELAAFHECSAGSIRTFLRNNGVQLRSRGRKKSVGV